MDEIDKAILNDHIEQASLLRGSFINSMIVLERHIDEYICRHFTKDEVRKAEMKNLLISTNLITFEKKFQVFRELIRKYSHDFHTENPKIGSHIITLIEQRNILAHYLLEENFQYDDTGNHFSFIKFEKEPKIVNYTPAYVEELQIAVRVYIKKIEELLA